MKKLIFVFFLMLLVLPRPSLANEVRNLSPGWNIIKFSNQTTNRFTAPSGCDSITILDGFKTIIFLKNSREANFPLIEGKRYAVRCNKNSIWDLALTSPFPSPVLTPTPRPSPSPSIYPTQSPSPSPTNPQKATQVVVDEEEYISGPTVDYLDSPFFTIPLNDQGSIRSYSANGHTYRFSGSLASPKNEGITLRAGPGGKFDECGAWLSSVYKLTAEHWIGWYHGEYDCHYDQGITHMSMAFVESLDGGITWEKTGYPNNQILTPYNSQNNEGGGHILPIGDYFYMFYNNELDWKIRVARASIQSQGRPGAWYKYYNGSFSEPGLGGNSSPANDNIMNAFVVFNSYLNEYISILVSGKWGFFMSQSVNKDIFNWKRFPQMIFPFVSYTTDARVDKWINRSDTGLQVYSYPSIIGIDGNSDTVGQSFYLYYTKLFPGENFDKRYLLRRKITLSQNSTSNYNTKLAFVRYQKQSPKKIKVSTEIAKPSEGYQKQLKLGYLLTYAADGFDPLYECYIPNKEDYFVSISDPSKLNWEHCETPEDVFVRRIGWFAKNSNEEASIAIYRCFDQTNLDHFVSTDPNCEGSNKDWLIGYIFTE